MSHALDIAKREIIVEGVIDGWAPLQPMQPFQLYGTDNDLLGFNSDGASQRLFYINHVEHVFTVPQGDVGNSSASEGPDVGYVTRFTAWTIPPTFDLTTLTGEAEEA
jgi:hypothetical protein